MYTEEQYRAKLEEVHAERLRQVPYTETSVEEARKRFFDARARVEQIEAEAQQELRNRAMGYMHHDARSQHVAAINARVQAAKDELRDAQEHFDKVSRDPMALALEARKREQVAQAKRDEQRAAEQAQHAKEQEATAKEDFRMRFLASGGTEAQFAAAWPGMWAKELERRTAESQDQVSQLKARMQRSGRYAF
ncbi:MAG: hypothetical protein J2P36_36300 [Ktedonobacteraceae bacterium]|nr:hypothetical protein [Ktedonobacteraceae bacterium]